MVEVFTRERTRPRVGGELEHSKDWFANFQVKDVKSWEALAPDPEWLVNFTKCVHKV